MASILGLVETWDGGGSLDLVLWGGEWIGDVSLDGARPSKRAIRARMILCACSDVVDNGLERLGDGGWGNALLGLLRSLFEKWDWKEMSLSDEVDAEELGTAVDDWDCGG